DVVPLDFPSMRNELGIKGVGESGIISPVPAIANAVEDALADRGVEITRVPLTAASVWEALRDARRPSGSAWAPFHPSAPTARIPFEMDERTFARAAEEYAARLYAVAYRLLGNRADAEDAVQRALLKAFEARASYAPRWALSTWLYRVLTNVCI